MATDLIHDRGRGPEIAGTRITVYNLLSHLLDSTMTEATMCRLYKLTPEQVAAARAYVLNNLDTVLAAHLKIEERMAAGNVPAVIEKARATHAAFLSFKEWLAHRDVATAQEQSTVTSKTGRAGSGQLPSFREWLAEQEPRPVEGP
ncbi:MAG TPA: DUF433 domain-containing protein [Elusimicrobiota bacterium]|nr:DUF433 domain-containing protein [Pirellulales bacterium]HVA65510.1 DUF433 domain-containing protein [Elusimicrobiota bacterium]